ELIPSPFSSLARSPMVSLPLLLLSLLFSLVFSVPLMQFRKSLNGTDLAMKNIQEFKNRNEFGVALGSEQINQRRYLGMTRKTATDMVNRFLKQSIDASGGKVLKDAS
ncbi:hypothetical protein PENTCL1PPCAC_1945, partial [Pristionchus entomophagus]